MGDADLPDARLLLGFEAGTLAPEQFGHRTHVRVAYLLLAGGDTRQSAARMRGGLLRLNAAHGAPDELARGYHETVTGAYLRLVAPPASAAPPGETSDDFCRRHPWLLDRAVLGRHYSPVRLWSWAAKGEFLEPDLAPLPPTDGLPPGGSIVTPATAPERDGVAAGGRVRLRPVEAGDLPRMFEMQLDPESNRMAVTIPRSREAFDAHWANALGDTANSARAVLLDGEMVGYISCFPMDGEDHVGYWIDREFWGRGIAGRALELLLAGVTKRPLVATAATSNGASLRVLRKCGFAVEAVRRSPATDRYPECEEAVLVLGTPARSS